jgi:predicted DsbA family dithiol-disulfide isomerase
MTVTMVIDVICSGSYVGFTRLRRAIARLDGPMEVSFLPYQLYPEAPPYGEPLLEVLERRFGAEAVAHSAQAAEDAKADGLRLEFGRAVAANSFAAHRLIADAAGPGRAVEMVERLFRAHFTDGLDIGDRATLDALADEVGVTGGAIPDGEIRARLERVREMGVTSIPVFLLAGRRLTGVPTEDELLAALR